MKDACKNRYMIIRTYSSDYLTHCLLVMNHNRYQTTMSLMNKITRNIDHSLEEYTRLIAERFDLDQESLLEMWNNLTKMRVRPKNAPKKRSAYQCFCEEQRSILKKQNPDISFGEVSKITSNRWKALTEKEKDKYKHIAHNKMPTPKDKPLVEMSKSQLLEKALQMGIKIAKSKPKEFIIKSIQDAENKDKDHDGEESGGETDETESITCASSAEGASPSDVSALIEEEEEEEDDVDHVAIYKKMTCSELVQLCKSKGLATSGSKEVLIRRLIN